jgi:predicted membrane-bound spermidine synthase
MLLLIVILSGMTTMATEMAGSRLLDPYFGNSQIVWASLIGLIMLYLSAGYFLGGRLADRWPHAALLYRITLWASFVIGLIPFVARPILRFAVVGLGEYQAGLLVGSLLGVLALFSIPIVLLGCVSPFAIRLAMQDVTSAGHTSGRIYALSTVGSIAGTFLPVLLLVPTIGTRATFILISAVLLFPSLIGLLWHAGRRGLPYLLMPIILIAIILWQGNRPIKETAQLIYETESTYNYIQVLKDKESIILKLNEGEGIHSIYTPSETLTYATWDYFLVVPYFNNPPYGPEQVRSVCMVGLAAGTIPKLLTAAYGPIAIDGAEIDPRIIDVGRQYFAMNEPNLHAYAEDGRRFLARSETTYDIIAVDAYRPPYIPFHLTTREFFEEARRRLTADGVVAINVGRTATDASLIDALAATMASVFPSVYVINEPLYGYDLGNAIVVATNQPTELANFASNLPALAGYPLLAQVANRTLPHIMVADISGPVFTDDRAPVEQVVHRLILRYALDGS